MGPRSRALPQAARLDPVEPNSAADVHNPEVTTTARTSVLDVLDGFFGSRWRASDVEGLTDGQLVELAAQVDKFYQNWSVPCVVESGFRAYGGGAAAVQPQNPGLPFVRSALLYADEIVIHCPLDEWIFRKRGSFRVPGAYRSNTPLMNITLEPPRVVNDGSFWTVDHEENVLKLKQALQVLERYEVPIRDGWMIPVPHLRYWKSEEESIWTQIRKDVLDLEFHSILDAQWQNHPAIADFIRGGVVTPGSGWHPKDAARAKAEAPSLYFNRTLVIGNSAHARFTPAADSDLALLIHKAKQATLLNRDLRDVLLVRALDEFMVPDFDDQALAEICSIRRQADGFAEWRSRLAAIVSGKVVPTGSNLQEVQSLLSESIVQTVEELKASVRADLSLKARIGRARMEALDLGVLGVAFLAPGKVGLAMSLPPILKMAVQTLRSPTGGAGSVVLRLGKSNVFDVNMGGKR